MRGYSLAGSSKPIEEGALAASALHEQFIDLAERDIAFLVSAAEASHAEIAAAKAARSGTTGLEVRTLAAQLQRDHERSFGELKALAIEKQIVLPRPADLGKTARTPTAIGTLTGRALEHAWVRMMIDDHREDMALFILAKESEDPDIRAFAEKTLPTLRRHFASLQKLEDHLGL